MKEFILKKPYLSSILLVVSLLIILPVAIGGNLTSIGFFSSLRNPMLLSTFLLAILLFKKSYRESFYSAFIKGEYDLSIALERRVLWIMISFYLIVFLKVIYNNYYSFNVSSVDFSIYANMIPNTLAGKFMYAEGMSENHFGVHFTPIIFSFWPLYLIFKTPLVALYIHPLIILSTVYPLYLLMKKKKIPALLRVIIVFSFLNYVYVAQILKFNFHIEVFYIPLFMWLFYLYENSKKVLFFIVIILINMVKEDGALYLLSTLIAMFLFLKKDRKFIVGCFLFSLIYFAINMKLIMPYFQDGSSVKLLGNKYGATLPLILKGMLVNWYKVIGEYFSSGWLKSILPFILIPIFSPFFIISTAIFSLIHSSSGNPLMEKLSLYYSAPIISIIFYTLLMQLKKVYRFDLFNRVVFRRSLILFAFVLCNLTGGSYHRFQETNKDYNSFKKLRSMIKKNRGEVCVQNSIFSHLAHSIENHFISAGCLDRSPKYIVLNDEIRSYPFNKEYIKNLISKYKNSISYEMKNIKNFYLFIKKGI